MINTPTTRIHPADLKAYLHRGIRRIAPLWSLENFVAVNPYLGLADMEFTMAMNFLHRVGKTQATLPRAFYLDALQEGRITKEDIASALADQAGALPQDVDQFLAELETETPQAAAEWQIQTFSEVASCLNGKNWERFMVDRISFWASAYFDQDQAPWDTAPGENSLFQAWKREAEVDYSAEAMGLKGFRNFIEVLPNDHLEAAARALEVLDIPESSLEHYFSGLLMKMNGWAGYAARIDWEANLAGQESQAVEEFLAILLLWEMGLHTLLPYSNLEREWEVAKHQLQVLSQADQPTTSLSSLLILQEAFDRANQRRIIQKLHQQPRVDPRSSRPKAQAIFCIDVRSEVLRRHLEAADAGIETMGFAGFFAFPIEYVPLAHASGTSQCPVLLRPTHVVKESLVDAQETQKAMERRTLREQVAKAWKSFKLGAVTCFSFVGPVGLSYLPKLFTDSFGLTRPVAHPDHRGLSQKQLQQKAVRLDTGDFSGHISGIPLEDRVQMGLSALKAMSLTDNFARMVLIVGHGSTTVNNPHATGLDCGACGGHTGESNAKVAAAVLNDREVRRGLQAAGIEVPAETIFVAALHDTTTDEVQLFYGQEQWPSTHRQEWEELTAALHLAGEGARKERAARMNIKSGDISKQVILRSKDWSQVRPEWGLAGCSSFIVAPRARTQQLDFGGKAFMHNYSWQKDTDFSVLELIMTAPMVVTSWINLQYYASTVDNKRFGSGNKTLHNVVGGLGVLEGFGGDLRVGLPWQSVHDGTRYQHEPQRLNVIIEAPINEMSKILARHESVRQLCDHRWIYLFAMNEEGKVAYRYVGDLEWEKWVDSVDV
jgi:uncharacterized protein YbcC (UPF0753/DUF2309 family)